MTLNETKIVEKLRKFADLYEKWALSRVRVSAYNLSEVSVLCAVSADLITNIIAERDNALENASQANNTLSLHRGDVMSLSNEIDLLNENHKAEIEAGERKLARYSECLKYYADQYCEGLCEENGGKFDDCDGCKARLILEGKTYD